ncbi:MAG: hypothetical protein ABXS92_01985 [Sulfurimonas sp.]
MNEILLSSEVIVYLLAEVLLYLLLLVASIVTVNILKKWDFDQFTPSQFALENRTYLVMSIIFFVLLLKVLLLPYFVYTIDTLSLLVPGAMCAAGVIDANEYGNPLLALKIVILFLSGLWLFINHVDLEAKRYPYIRLKSWLYLLVFLFLSAEMVLDVLYFIHIDTVNPVSCCSVIFGISGGSNRIPFGLDTTKLLVLFYLLYLLLLFTVYSKSFGLRVGIALSFLWSAYYSMVYFFGTYIYELPTHQCPFCMLQKEYYFVGYLLWGLLLLGIFLSVLSAIAQTFFDRVSKEMNRIWVGLLTLFVLICSGYVGVYYFKNGVFL